MENIIMEQNREEMKQPAGGKPGLIDGPLMLFSWIACGFHHNYKYTGKTKNDLDLFIRKKFYQRICRDCGHEDWTCSAP